MTMTDLTPAAIQRRWRTFRGIAIAFAVLGVLLGLILIPAGAWWGGFILIGLAALIWWTARAHRIGDTIRADRAGAESTKTDVSA
jgi:hypothetical protein